jgi:hypothetical protein
MSRRIHSELLAIDPACLNEADLEAVRPPLRQSSISNELLAFEEAIRKVEAEIARRARETG